MSAKVTTWDTLEAAHAALRNVVANVADDYWNKPTPCAQWNVAQVVQHAAMDQLLYAASITGAPKPEGDAFAPTGKLEEPALVSIERAVQASSNAWSTIAVDAEQVPVPLPPFALPATIGVAACALDAAVHAWDIAVATSQPSPLTTELARAIRPAADTVVEPVRAWGAYATALAVPADADEITALLLFLGRRPDWHS